MFLNCQKPGLIKDPYIYKPDSIMLDLEDAVAENQKDAARYSLYHALQEIDYRGVERVVRINGLDTPHWKEDIRVCVAGGADTIRIAKTESAQDVHTVEEHVLAAEREFGRPEGSTLLMAALESCKGVLNALEVCKSSDRLIGIALDGDTYCFLHIQSPLLGNIAFQRNALNQFHHNIMKFSLIHDIINTDNIRVRQTGRRLGFHFELADKALIGAKFIFQYFDRHISVQFMAFGFINIRHSTGANQLQDLITFLKIRSCP